jgi:hypothetical protein
MAIEIVDLPIENGGFFHRFLYVYQRVNHGFHTQGGWWSFTHEIRG